MVLTFFLRSPIFSFFFPGGRRKRRRMEEKGKRERKENCPKIRCPKVNEMLNDPRMENISIKTTSICNRMVQKIWQ